MTEQTKAAQHPDHTNDPSPDDIYEISWTLEVTERWTRQFTRAELAELGVDFPPEAGDMSQFASDQLPGFEDSADDGVDVSADVSDRYITGVRWVQDSTS